VIVGLRQLIHIQLYIYIYIYTIDVTMYFHLRSIAKFGQKFCFHYIQVCVENRRRQYLRETDFIFFIKYMITMKTPYDFLSLTHGSILLAVSMMSYVK
jgi:hypothetical protein